MRRVAHFAHFDNVLQMGGTDRGNPRRELAHRRYRRRRHCRLFATELADTILGHLG